MPSAQVLIEQDKIYIIQIKFVYLNNLFQRYEDLKFFKTRKMTRLVLQVLRMMHDYFSNPDLKIV
ncbi:hypothetical protein BpHYR1_004780 [Brachionus plicatilis]|uniref:Uncharacterized protein n=1 Tax=Brachionus plicatilis TaxID=10195 RepID=A0A3M7SZW0_BRAPC|nr:hypothetical protein BpHYR1_004780 [Brachionus plicatilis]